MRPRVGHIQFLNCLPIYYGLVRGNGLLDLDLVRGMPTELNGLLLDGALDISPISSIEYARHAERLVLLPGPTVSCRGAVQSITLLSRRPIEDLDGASLGLTRSSATSHVLLRIILEEGFGVRPEYFPFDDLQLAETLEKADAVLLIGDRALEHDPFPGGFTGHDLGRLWHDLTGCGMVFAVWAVRRAFADRHPDLVQHVWELFQESILSTANHLDLIAADAARWERFDASFLANYFRTLQFDFEPDLREGLLRFYEMAAALGETGRREVLEFIAPNGTPPHISPLRGPSASSLHGAG